MTTIDIKDVSLTKLIGVGSTSRCYLGTDNYVVKIFKSDVILYHEKYFNIDNIKKLSELNTKHIIAPEAIILKDGCLYGYKTRYINSPTLNDIDYKVKLKKLIRAYKILKKELDKLQTNYQLLDVHTENILYNGKLYLIDLDYGSFEEEDSTFENENKIIKTIINNLYGFEGWCKLEFNDCSLNEIYKYIINGEGNYFLEYCEILFQILQDDNINIYDIQKNRSKLLRG